jgi:hypothetical protein
MTGDSENRDGDDQYGDQYGDQNGDQNRREDGYGDQRMSIES